MGVPSKLGTRLSRGGLGPEGAELPADDEQSLTPSPCGEHGILVENTAVIGAAWALPPPQTSSTAIAATTPRPHHPTRRPMASSKPVRRPQKRAGGWTPPAYRRAA